MKTKVTKIKKLLEVNNEKCHNFYYLVCGRIYSPDGTKFRRFRFVEWFDAFDVMDFSEKDHYDKNDVRALLDAMIDGNLSLIKSFDDCKDFYEMCDASIRRYNGV